MAEVIGFQMIGQLITLMENDSSTQYGCRGGAVIALTGSIAQLKFPFFV
ncbi:hypothetical protein [Paenibacillus sp. LjRoot56]